MALLDWFRDKKRRAPHSALAMVLVSGQGRIDPASVFDYLRANWNDIPRITDVETEDTATTATIRGGALGFVHTPARVPPGDLEGPARVAWHWPDAAAQIERHQGHVIVHASSNAFDLLDLRLLHTKLVASCWRQQAGWAFTWVTRC